MDLSVMRPLALPPARLKLTKKNNQLFVWCIIRKKTLLLTPEEWVRQHVIHFLINEKNIPQGLIAAEMPITVNQLSRRCDLVVFDSTGKPKLIVECKAPEISLTEQVFYQIAQYNSRLRVDYLMISNGSDHFFSKIDANGELCYFNRIPDWNEL